MNQKISKIDVIAEFLQAPWHTIESYEKGVRIKGMTKSDVIELSSNEIDIVAKLLKNSNLRVKFGAISILKEFRELARDYILEIVDQFFMFDEKHQIEIIRAIKYITGKAMVTTFEKLIVQELSYDVLLEMLFRVSLTLEEDPFNGMRLILKSSKNELMWRMIKEFIQKALNNPFPMEEKFEILDLSELRPAIGISQEAEMKRSQLKGIDKNISKAIFKIRTIETTSDKTQQNNAKKLLKELKKIK